ncbi:MAG TPA: tetratricopeptide repeat protein, partial [Nitrososphaera sp.]|nr:tetratricopeptide repeat protein [Nitrososphaera sp.]
SKQGQDLFKAKRFDEAIKVYGQLLKMEPDDAATHFNLGAALEAAKDIDSAIPEYKNAIRLDSKNEQYAQALEDAMDVKAQPTIDKAVAAHKAKKYTEAIDLYNQALRMRPKNDELWYNLGAACYSREDYQGAQSAYQHAYELAPKQRADVLYFLGTIDEDESAGTKALNDYRRYIKEAPSGTYVAQANERIKVLQKDPTQTVKIKSEADIAKEKDAIDSFKQAVELQKSKQYDQALPLYQKSISLMPNNADFVYGLGTLKQAMGQYDEAIQLYAKAKTMSKGDTKIMDEAITAANQDKAQPLVDEAVKKQTGGDNEGAAPLYQQALQLIPNNAEVWKNYGIALQDIDQFQQARDAYDKSYKIDAQKNVDCLYLMAVIDEHYGQGAKAKSEYDLYLQRSPSGQYVQLAKGRRDALAKNPSDTQKLLTRAERSGIQNADVAYKKGLDEQNNKNFDAAIADYQIAFQAVPTEPAYPFAIGTAYQAKNDLDNAKSYYQKAISLSKDKAQIKKFQ